MRFTSKILSLVLLVGGPVAADGKRQAAPESSLQLVRGQLAIGQYALGMTVSEVEALHGQSVPLRPNVDDTGQCEGLDAAVSVGGNPVILTFTKHGDGLRIQKIFVRFPKVRRLGEVAAEVSRRVPTLRLAEHDPLIKGNESFWTLSSDPLQIVPIGVTEGLWVTRGCVNGVATWPV